MICAIVLAAGRSSRMGLQKLLLPFAGKTVITHIVDQLLAGAIDNIYVVVGHEPDRITEQLSDHPVSIVINPNYDSGMLSSVRCGFKALSPDCDAALIALGDQPGITSKLVDDMVRSFNKTDKGILVPLHNGTRGHPIIVAKHYQTEILTRYDDIGLRGLLHAHPDDIFELSVSTSSVLFDMDYPEDYLRELSKLPDNTDSPNNPPSQ
ncbi:MAG: nucleotidyltransferase family protein [Planctomycetota bacterium]